MLTDVMDCQIMIRSTLLRGHLRVLHSRSQFVWVDLHALGCTPYKYKYSTSTVQVQYSTSTVQVETNTGPALILRWCGTVLVLYRTRCDCWGEFWYRRYGVGWFSSGLHACPQPPPPDSVPILWPDSAFLLRFPLPLLPLPLPLPSSRPVCVWFRSGVVPSGIESCIVILFAHQLTLATLLHSTPCPRIAF